MEGSTGGHRRRCINCSICLAYQTSRLLREASESMLTILNSWISPTQHTLEDRICSQCFLLLQEVQDERSTEPAFGHRSVCFCCGISTLRSRTQRVTPNCPQWDMIIGWTSPHLVPHLQRVCRACWMAATRNMQRQVQHDTNRPSEEQTRIPSPPALPEPNFISPHIQQESRTIICNVYRRVASTTRHCIFQDCTNIERLLIPVTLKQMLLKNYKIYIPSCARICSFHLCNDCWDQLSPKYRDFTASQFDNMLKIMEDMATKKIDFNNINEMPPNLCHYWLGINADQFYELLNCIPHLMGEVPKPSLALSIYLVKIRTGDSNERLSTLFDMSRSSLERYMTKARNALSMQFVPSLLGINHMSVQDVASRNRLIPDGLFGNPNLSNDMKPAIVICDATYVYIQNSFNYLFQKETYSLHKHLNLVKPFMVVCCDGHILDCLGPYRATVNDAEIMKKEFINDTGSMRNYFRQGDVFILDRGFRDVMPDLQQYGFKAYMPESLLEGESQLTTEQANKSRCVTMCRWVVEVVNGRLKRDFKLFRQEYFNRAASHLMEDFRIGCALTNKFHPLIEDNPHAQLYLERAQQRFNLRNYLAEFVQSENINRRRINFQTIDGGNPHLNNFPILTLEDLKLFAVGSYQLKQARSYYGEHIRQNGTYIIEINEVIEEDLPLILGLNNYLIRGRIKSRHIGSKTYYTYLLINKDAHVANTLEALVGYCCSCLVGKRTVGCCAHIMTITWYLSWARYQDVYAPAQFLDEIFDEFLYETEQ